MATCPKCNGQKKQRVLLTTGVGRGVHVEATCDACKGMGEVGVPGACPECNGSKKAYVPLSTSGISAVTVDCPKCTREKRS